MTDTDHEFKQDVERIFSQLRLLPEDVIAGIHSSGSCEDGATFQLMLDTIEGATIVITATPGQRLAVSVHQ